jgi:hypothetical protein
MWRAHVSLPRLLNSGASKRTRRAQNLEVAYSTFRVWALIFDSIPARMPAELTNSALSGASIAELTAFEFRSSIPTVFGSPWR